MKHNLERIPLLPAMLQLCRPQAVGQEFVCLGTASVHSVCLEPRHHSCRGRGRRLFLPLVEQRLLPQ